MATDGSTAGAVVITGASTGIGQACALRLDRAGFRVFAGVRREADAERLKQEASQRLTPLTLDVTDQSQIESAARTLEQAAGGGLVGLVNNAGISVAGPLEFVPIEDLRRQLEVNTIGSIAVTQAFMPLLRKGRGRIVNIGSIGGRMATPFLGPYAASKFALEALTDCLRMELRPWGMHVVIVEPGSITTPIWEKGYAMADEMEQKLPEEALMLYRNAIDAMRKAAHQAEGRGIPPDEVAKVVQHALTASRPKTRYVVGFDAQVQRFLGKYVPDRMRDGLVARQLGLPGTP